MLFNFALKYAITKVQANLNGLKLNVTHRLLFYADNVNILGGTVHTVMRNTDALLGVIKESGLDVEADKSKYIIMYRDQNAG